MGDDVSQQKWRFAKIELSMNDRVSISKLKLSYMIFVAAACVSVYTSMMNLIPFLDFTILIPIPVSFPDAPFMYLR